MPSFLKYIGDGVRENGSYRYARARHVVFCVARDVFGLGYCHVLPDGGVALAL